MARRWVGYMNAANAITFAGAGLGLWATVLAAEGAGRAPLMMLMWAGIADLFDGFVARKLKLSPEAREYGKQLDSLADVVSFGVLPAVLWHTYGLRGGADLALLTAYVLCALARLAFFNVHGLSEGAGRSFYQGLPVTFIALILPVVATALDLTRFPAPLAVHRLTAAVTAVAFVAGVPIPKPRGAWYAIFPTLAVAVLLLNVLR